MSSVAGEYRLGHRYLHLSAQKPATLRYIGPLETSENVQPDAEDPPIWLGVEWDDPARGKHSGFHLQRSYFNTRVEGAGSFLKWKVKDAKRDQEESEARLGPLWKGRSFPAAIKYQYLTSPEDDGSVGATNLKLGSSNNRIEVEVPNLDKVTSKFSNLRNLTHLGLDQTWVNGAGLDNLDGMNIGDLTSIKSLDISSNLLHSWDDLLNIINVLPSLTDLKLNHSRLPRFDLSAGVEEAVKCLQKIRSLTMRDCLIAWDDLLKMGLHMPNLQYLDIAVNSSLCNGVINYSPAKPLSFYNLKELVIGDCSITKWATVVEICKSAPSLESLDISVNPLCQIDAPSQGSLNPLSTIRTLIIKETQLKSSKSLDNLSTWLPGVTVLKISAARTEDVEIGGQSSGFLTGQKSDRPVVLASFSMLEELNSSPVTASEKEEAKRIASIAGSKVSNDLIQKSNQPAKNNLRNKFIALRVSSEAADSTMLLDILPSAPLKILFVKLRRQLSLDQSHKLSVTIHGREFDESHANDKLSDLGCRNGDELELGLVSS